MIVENDIKKFYHKWLTGNCEKSIYGKELREIKDIHKGEKCIIVGNGPSLSVEDLNAICDANIVTLMGYELIIYALIGDNYCNI